MTQIANAFDTYEAVGNREDLSDLIYNISPTETPFISMIAGRTTATAVKHEWQTDALADADDTNAQLEGDEIATVSASTPTERLSNYCQISRKTVGISGTQEVVSKAGRASEMAYQISKRADELKRDMEKIITGNQAVVTGNASTARKLRSLESWLVTNVNRGVGGANGSSTEAATDATAGDLRYFTEQQLKDVIQQVYNSGGNPDTIMVGLYNKQKVSSDFPGNATRMIDAETRTLVAAIDVYKSDFGTLTVVPNRFQRGRTAFVLESKMWSVAYLRPFMEKPLADIGDGDRRLMLAEYTLESKNEAASGVIADLQTVNP